ncbi:MAG: cysteine-rich CWC family protein [Chitinophagaceae bacterium]
MGPHETKDCPRCNKPFQCKVGNITQCHCFGIQLKSELKIVIEQRYHDCLCADCLKHLLQEMNLFKENYFPK